LSGERSITIKGLMRHEDLKSTEVYTKVSPDYLKQASDNLNYGLMPVGKKKDKK
jgi:site-specific recombinase XerD